MRAIAAIQPVAPRREQGPEEPSGPASPLPEAPASAPRASAWPLGRSESALLVSILAAAFLLRLLYIFRYGFNSDEAQELHVAWAWTRGQIPYRDLFDNHAPLFPLLSAPLAAVVGETPRILFAMRLAVTLCYAAALWGTFGIGRAIFGARAGLWAAALLALVPTFFLKSIEYRADDLWAALWVLGLAVLVGGEWTWGRGFAAGLLLGAALATSLKTVLLVVMLAVSALALPLLTGDRHRAIPWRAKAPPFTALVAGLCGVPAALMLFFAVEGALGPLLHGTILHNCLPGLGSWSEPHSRALWFAPAALMAAGGVRRLVRIPSLTARARASLALLALTALLYLLGLHTLWPLFTVQDLLPFFPLAAVVTTGLMTTGLAAGRGVDGTAATGRTGPARAGRDRVVRALAGPRFLSLVALLEIGILVAVEPPWRNGTRPQTRLLADVLRLTGPSDRVLDTKGETIFRRRPIYEVMETITETRLQRGDLAETIPEQAIARKTCVAVADIRRFPDRTRAFLEENYLQVGALRVAGRFLDTAGSGSSDPGAGQEIAFTLPIASRYAIVAERGGVSGLLDGAPYLGPRLLEAGSHTFRPSSGSSRLAVIWAQAAERGFSPFATQGPAS